MGGASASFLMRFRRIKHRKIKVTSWRDDPGMECKVDYRKKFAFLPVICHDGTKVWLKRYYKKYELWSHKGYGSTQPFDLDHGYLHTDFIENVSEAEYIIRKLAENF